MSEPKQVRCLRPDGVTQVSIPEHLVGKKAFRVQGLRVIPEADPHIVHTPEFEKPVEEKKRGPGRPSKNETE